jgi:hypothetical protein
MLKALFVVYAGGSITGYYIGIIGSGLCQHGEMILIFMILYMQVFLIGSIKLGNAVDTIIGSFFSHNFGRY